MTQRWDVPDDDQNSAERATPTLVSLHFIRGALRRRWLVCLLCPVLGLLAAIAFLVALPPSHKATASLVLAHDPQVDPSRAMATDVSLLRTRTAAAMTVASLGLSVSPDDFLKSVTAVPVSSELMTLTLSAPSDAEAVRRLDALTSIYLGFRGDQLSRQSNVLIGSMQQRIAALDGEVKILSRQIDDLSSAGNSSADKLSDQIAQRAYVQGRIEALQQSVEDMTLQTTSVVSSSVVIDPAAAETGGAKKRIVLILASGLIGGAALGWGTVLFFAIISDRLRRRSDIADALELPVPLSVGRITPISERWLRIPYLRRLDGRRAVDRQRLAHAIELELPEPSRQGRLAVACIDNAEEVRFAVADAATDLAASGLSVAVIDLTQQGNLAAGVRPSTPGSSAPPIVLRPGGIPELASAADLRAVEREDAIAPSIEGADVVLVFADVEPSIGAEYLTAWTDRVILMVTSGRSSTERLRTAVDLSRAVGLDLRFAALLRTERADDSLGGTLTHADKAPVGEQEWAEAVADEEEWAEALAEEEGPVDALATDEQEWAEPIVDEEWAEALADEEWAEALADDEQNQEASAADEQEPAEALTEEAETPEALTEEAETPEALTEEAETPEALTEEAETPEALTEEAETPEALTEEPETLEALDTDDEVTGADRQPDTETIVEDARGEEQPPDHAEAQPVESEQGAPPEDQPAEHEEAPATELVAEADPTAGLPNQGEAVNGWFSDTAEEPLAHVGSVPSPDSGEFDWSWDWSLDDADTTEQQAVEARHDASDEDSQADVEPAPTSNGSEPDWNHTSSIDESDSTQQAMDAWRLYIDEYPLVHVGAAPADEDPHGQSHHRAGNGQASSGVRRQRSRSRSRRKKSGHK